MLNLIGLFHYADDGLLPLTPSLSSRPASLQRAGRARHVIETFAIALFSTQLHYHFAEIYATMAISYDASDSAGRAP